MTRKDDEPLVSYAEANEVIVDGPGSIRSLTPAAARTSGERLIEAAAVAECAARGVSSSVRPDSIQATTP